VKEQLIRAIVFAAIFFGFQWFFNLDLKPGRSLFELVKQAAIATAVFAALMAVLDRFRGPNA
jgi:hypothetical protein